MDLLLSGALEEKVHQLADLREGLLGWVDLLGGGTETKSHAPMRPQLGERGREAAGKRAREIERVRKGWREGGGGVAGEGDSDVIHSKHENVNRYQLSISDTHRDPPPTVGATVVNSHQPSGRRWSREFPLPTPFFPFGEGFILIPYRNITLSPPLPG